ncbi:MAG: outer membrane beta-barrel protein [Bacteroidetes bacterium]|nr:outer membrane beta-barrel protein [Bacteroidota bacterium]MBS1757168.1 outer membrane beta-barrel protein [Bacteroidota bacterium]
MRLKNFSALLIVTLLFSTVAESQVIMVRPGGRYYRPRRMVRPVPPSMRRKSPPFQPTINLSIGYGYPNLDKNYLPDYANANQGNISQMGPITGSFDYRFSRNISIGALVTHGWVSAPYFDISNPGTTPDFNVKFNNWSFMLNLKSYLAAGGKVEPYIRTAIGINSWQQNFTDGTGAKINMQNVDLPDLAYQVGLGAEFKLSKNAAFYAEAGYGKYILNGGLTFKF